MTLRRSLRLALGAWALVLLLPLVPGGCGSGTQGAPDAAMSVGDAALDGGGDGDANPGLDGGPSDGGGPAEAGDDASVPPPGPLFDLPAIRDPSTAACTFSGERSATRDGTSLRVWDVSYTSFELVAGATSPITIRGFAARPTGATFGPGIVQAHGLGGYATEAQAIGPAALLGMFTLAFTGPGGGAGVAGAAVSEGLPSGHDSGRRMFDTIPDPRGSWFWGHAVAAMRGLTCLATRPEVDATRLGMTGYSAGGVVTLISSGVDDRIIAAVPLSASLRWDRAVESPTAWQHGLLATAGYDASDPHWTELLRWLDPSTLFAGGTAHVFMVNGTSDEFFPLTAHMATYDAIAGRGRRLSFVGNGDHGCTVTLGVPGIDSAAEIQARADLRAKGAQRAWFRHYVAGDPTYACIPVEPTFTLTPAGSVTFVAATVDESCRAFDVESVHVWWSNDDAESFLAISLSRLGAESWGTPLSAPALFPTTPSSIALVDAQYRQAGVIEIPPLVVADRFSVSSRPVLPAGHVPRIRSSTTCLVP